MAQTKKTDEAVGAGAPVGKRTYLKQSDVPAASLEDALRVPQAIVDHYASKPTTPLYVAKALNVDPQGSQFKLLTGASIAFGLTEGGAQAAAISVTDLAKNILKPTVEGVEVAAKREAVLKPRVFGDFLRTYNGHPLPREDIALNVLEEMGVPRDKTAEVNARIISSAHQVGFLMQFKGKDYVSLEGADGIQSEGQGDALNHSPDKDAIGSEAGAGTTEPPFAPAVSPTSPKPTSSMCFQPTSSLAVAIADDARRRRVFITHGKNRDLVDPIKHLLEYGELTPVVSVERQSVSKPVPEKVMDDMRSCGAAIIHVDADRKITDTAGSDHVLLNPNVLIEIGAAMAFYGRRFILLVREDVQLPSNLQGLYEVRYSGDTLDATATIKLLEAIKDIKNYGLPTDDTGSDS